MHARLSLHGLLQAGLQPGQPAELQRRIAFSNRAALLYALLVLPYIAVTQAMYPALLAFPVAAVVGFLLCIPLNSLGLIYLSRVISSLLINICITVYHACLLDAAAPPMASLYNIQLACMLMPWVLFSSEEKGWLAATMCLNVMLFFSYPVLNPLLEMSLDDTPFRSGSLAVVSHGVAVVMLVTAVYFLNQFHRQSAAQNILLLAEMAQKQQAMQQAESDMKRSIQQLEQAQQAERQRNWMVEGIAQCTRLIRLHGNSDGVHDKLLQFVVGYVEANQGALFVVGGNESQPYLEQSACYAYGRKKYQDRRIEAGQGLAGQVYLERETVYLTQVPDQYIRISSGLGDARPRAVLVVPLKENDRVEGVLELAGFKPFQPHQIEFLEKLGEVVASSLHNARVSAITQKLLEESRQQAEQMRAQEEEMRQNLEELAATQEEMERKERDYIARLTAVESRAAHV